MIFSVAAMLWGQTMSRRRAEVAEKARMKRALYALRLAQHPLCMPGEKRAWHCKIYEFAPPATASDKARLRLMTWG